MHFLPTASMGPLGSSPKRSSRAKAARGTRRDRSARRSAAKNAAAAKPQPAKFERREPRHDKPEKRHPAPADGSIEIYVGNLSYDLTDDQLRQAFEAYGKVNYARIITNKFNGKSKGFGFVHMPDPKEVEAALAGLDDKELMGRRLKCNVAKNVD